MKKALFLTLVFVLAAFLWGQQSNWHVYRPGGFSPHFCSSGDELWIVSGAGIMRWNTITDQKTQYDISNSPASISTASYIITAQDGSIWACGSSGVLHYHALGWESFDSTNSPLPSTGISKIVQDATGALWIGAQSGVYKYHQGNWTVFDSSNSNLPASQYVYSMALDNNNHVWMAGSDGVWNYFANIWVHYMHSNSSLPNSTVDNIAFSSDGTGWFGNSSGVAKYQNGNWQQYTVLHGISVTSNRCIYVDELDRLWICCEDNLLCIDGDNYVNYPRTLFADYETWFNSICVDVHQNIWVGFYDTYSPLCLAKFNGFQATFYPVCELPLPSLHVQEIFTGFDGKLWLGTADDNGIGGYLSIDGTEVQTFGMYNTNMPCDHVWSLAQDSQLNMWVGTCIGLLKTGPSGSVVYQSNDTGVGATIINTICAVGNEVWIGTANGVSCYINGSWNVLSPTEVGMNLNGCKIIKTDSSGRVWIGSYYGLAYRSEGQWTVYSQITDVKDLAFGPDGTVWVARGQISYLLDGVWNHYNTTNSALTSNHVISVAVDNFNVLWAGSSYPNYCLYRLESGFWRVYNSSNSVITSQIKCIYVDEQNTKWIGGANLVLFNETGIPSETEDLLLPKPTQVSSYPNPFTEATRICYEKVTQGDAKLSIYNLKGQKVWEYCDLSPAKGKKELTWNGKDQKGTSCAAGIYLIRVEEKGQTRFGKAVKL